LFCGFVDFSIRALTDGLACVNRVLAYCFDEGLWGLFESLFSMSFLFLSGLISAFVSALLFHGLDWQKFKLTIQRNSLEYSLKTQKN
jgi:hypothetical protein